MPKVTSPSGVAIAYDMHGTGTPALVFVHGSSCDRGYWKGQLKPFSKLFPVVAIDLGGHGLSGTNRTSWTIQEFGRDVATVVESLRLNQVILIGHSMGGDAIVEAARLLKGRVLGLIWVDTYKSLGSPRTPEEIQAIIGTMRDDFVEGMGAFVRTMFPSTADPALVDWIAKDMSSAPPEVELPTIEAALSFDREMPAALAELNLPVIAINPDYAPTDTDALQRHGVKVMILPGTGHFLMLEDPKGFNPLLQAAIEELVGQSRGT